jgi:hypothetical protein
LRYAVYAMRTPSDNRAVPWIGWSAGACWLASWFMPVIDEYNGWAAFIAALQGPMRNGPLVNPEDVAGQILSALTNVVFVALFYVWWRGRMTRPALYTKVAVACLVLNLYWLVMSLRATGEAGLLAGYWAWLAAFALLVALGAINVVSTRRTSRTPTGGMQA